MELLLFMATSILCLSSAVRVAAELTPRLVAEAEEAEEAGLQLRLQV